ncbi:MAG: tetratricopeptide repeat protein [Bacteroidota bacterium]
MKRLLLLVLLPMFAMAQQPMLASQSIPVTQPADSLIAQTIQWTHDAQHGAHPDLYIDAFDAATQATDLEPERAIAHYWAGYAGYRIGSMNMGSDKDLADEWLSKSRAHLERSIELEKSADAYALLSTVYSLQIGIKWTRGMSLGGKASGMLETAKALGPDNPRVALIDGIRLYNTPRMWGGNKDKAMEQFRVALMLFEEEDVTDPFQPAWGHPDAYAWLGIAYAQQDEKEQARIAYGQALEVSPGYAWVERILLPSL